MALTLVENVATYFRNLIDESDSTFIDDADVALYLERGYDQFRQVVSDVEPNFFVASVSTSLTNADEWDLDNVVFGTTPTDTRLAQIIRLYCQDGTGKIRYIFDPVYARESLYSDNSYAVGTRYILQGRKILFSTEVTDSVVLEYIPLSEVDWTLLNTGDNEYIDDLIQFHDMIALFAAQDYWQVDGAINPATEAKLQRRKAQLEDFVTRGRLRNANRFVTNDSPNLWGY